MAGRVITFTSLFPSAVKPLHGAFVEERMRRVVARGGFEWEVVAPVPSVPWPLRRREDRLLARTPPSERRDGVTVRHPRYLHVPGISMRAQARRMAKAASASVREAAAGRSCVVDAHYVYPDGVAAAEIAEGLGLRYTITARGSDVNLIAEDPVVGRQIRAACSRAHALFAVSDALCARFAEVAGLPRGRVRLARNGVDLERFRPGDAAEARAALGLPPQGHLLLGVGRLVPVKGFHLLAETLRAVDATLVLAGDGPERGRLASALPASRTRFLGALDRDRLALAYRACDLLVLPSESEGWPNVVTEALASGLPVVATRVGGVPQILAGGTHGRLVERGDARALASAVAELLAAPPAKAEVRAFATRWSWDEPVDLLVAAFGEALAG
jgi:glycosyltransferase involved in cell wall biosynthesis